MRNKTTPTLIAALGLAFAFNTIAHAQIRFSTQKKSSPTPVVTLPGPKSATSKSAVDSKRKQNAKPVNQNFNDTFNAIQKRKREAEGSAKKPSRQSIRANNFVDPNLIRGLQRQQRIGASRSQSANAATFGSTFFGPATGPGGKQRQTVGQQRVPIMNQNAVAARRPVIISNPFFKHETPGPNGRTSAFDTRVSGTFENQEIKQPPKPVVEPPETPVPTPAIPASQPNVKLDGDSVLVPILAPPANSEVGASESPIPPALEANEVSYLDRLDCALDRSCPK